MSENNNTSRENIVVSELNNYKNPHFTLQSNNTKSYDIAKMTGIPVTNQNKNK